METLGRAVLNAAHLCFNSRFLREARMGGGGREVQARGVMGMFESFMSWSPIAIAILIRQIS